MLTCKLLFGVCASAALDCMESELDFISFCEDSSIVDLRNWCELIIDRDKGMTVRELGNEHEFVSQNT